jgi:hypothetical protein
MWTYLRLPLGEIHEVGVETKRAQIALEVHPSGPSVGEAAAEFDVFVEGMKPRFRFESCKAAHDR